MSSWKKAAKSHQKTHRERHQPSHRSEFGLLEKKKDYKERTKNFHQQKNTIKVLKRKALNRNPDEFYFHMVNSRIQDGEHHELDKDEEHTPEQIKLMQTQDIRYIRTKRDIESKKVQKIQSELHILDAANKTENTHIFFVDSSKEAKNFDVASHLDTHPSLLKRRINRMKNSTLQQLTIPDISQSEMKAAVSARNKAYLELSKRIKREKQLKIIEEKLTIKRHLQNKKETPPERIKPGTSNAPPIYKWMYERKK